MTTARPTLYGRTFPARPLAARCAPDPDGVLLLAGLAQLEIVLPFTPVPVTGADVRRAADRRGLRLEARRSR